MQNILNKFHDCDCFSLSTVWKEDFLLTDGQAAHALKVYEEACVEDLRPQYAAFSEEQRAALPAFDELWSDFKGRFGSIGKAAELSGKQSRLMPDGVSPHLISFWSCAIDLGMCEGQAEKAMHTGKFPPEDTLPSEYAPIKPHLIQVLPSFFHHCTNGGLLRYHFIFVLNEATKEWLLQYPHPDCIDTPLSDFALYKDGFIKLSTCSHEGIYLEIHEKQRGIM